METSVKERLRFFIKNRGLTIKNFETSINVGNGFVNNIVSGIGADKLVKISNAYPELNTSWLLYNEGEMLRDNTIINKVAENNELVPLVPISAMAGELVGFNIDGITQADCERITSPIKGVDFAVPVYGESMYPEYPNGSRVLVKKINHNSFIEWGKVYVVDTANGIVLKQIRKSDNPDAITCYSLNDNSIYAPFDIHMKDVLGMYRVLMCLALK